MSSQEVIASTRKRPRPEKNPSCEEEQDQSHAVTLTPHTHRLLRLVQEGTTAHAQMAASHLTSIAAQSSPLVLWDLLGRLVETLSSPSWSCRYNASMAMEGIARHLPPMDQRQFLRSTHKQEENGAGLWLNIHDLGRNTETTDDDNERVGLDEVLENGRLLLASSGEQYDPGKDAIYQRETDQLQRLDASAGGANDFLKQRVRLQRYILAQRLGFSGVLELVTDDSLLSDTITNEDLLDTTVVSTEPSSASLSRRQQHMERIKKRRRVKNEENAQDDSSSVRALLVMEMNRQRKSSTTGAASHCNPQTLLTTELIYRMFSPSWHVRHGALLGALALLKAWRLSCDHNHGVFGVWPNDILARCLCVLALDRFGDYSGSIESFSEEASSNDFTGASGGGVVAPVREMAGQLLSVLLTMAPFDIQEWTLDLLLRMAQHPNEWEVRHGALLAMKYIAAVVTASASEKHSDLELQMKGLSRVAVARLVDDSDDVQSMAAQVLSCLFSGRPHQSSFDLNDLVRACSRPLWTALSTVRSVSSSGVDLVQLFSRILCHDCKLVLTCLENEESSIENDTAKNQKRQTLNRLLCKLLEFLDFDSMQVKLSTLQSIQAIAEPVSAVLQSSDSRQGQSSQGCAETYCSLLEKVFDSHFDSAFPSCSNSENEHERKQVELLGRVRDSAWTKLVDNSQSLLRCRQDHVKALLLSVTLRYFGIQLSKPGDGLGSHFINATPSNCESQQSFIRIQRVDAVMGSLESRDVFETRQHTSRTLAYLFSKLLVSRELGTGEIPIAVEFFRAAVTSMLQSPWLSLCEAACLLHKALCTAAEEKMSSIQPALKECQVALGDMLCGLPLCIKAESMDAVNSALSSREVVAVCDRAFVATLSSCLYSGDEAHCGSTRELVELWKQAINWEAGESGSNSVSVGSMRVNATIAGAMLQLGRDCLPTKLTPMIRSLMTSMRSETASLRQRETCLDLARLLTLLSRQTKKSEADIRIRDKVLENICVLSYAETANEGLGARLASHEAGTHVIEMLVGQISADANLETIPAVWARLKVVQDSERVAASETVLEESLSMMNTVAKSLRKGTKASSHLIELSMPSLVATACSCPFPNARVLAVYAVESLCSLDSTRTLERGLPFVLKYLNDMENDAYRVGGCNLLHAAIVAAGMGICAFVRCLLPTVMSLMTDPLEDCSKLASRSFAALVRVAPLVRNETSKLLDGIASDESAERIVDHLIHGKPLPPCVLPDVVMSELKHSDTILRNYQKEGIAWIRFLQTVNLCGALCDDMGCGKTLQALVGIAISHCQAAEEGEKATSLVVCPSSVVGHWVKEIKKFFPTETVFRDMSFIGNAKQRKALWTREISKCNIVVTSYSFLRSDLELLAGKSWRYCVLDEGHLLKNPKTATAIASRRIRARHRLILTGTPVQNRVHELWAAFDFLMPNFLGSAASFSKEFAKPITMGHLPDASAESITCAMEKLKTLHQQVLPFILRREKAQVLKELPPKCICDIPCSLSTEQEELYKRFCAGPQGKKSIAELQNAVHGAARELKDSSEGGNYLRIGSAVLKSLLYLRLLCTHPALVSRRSGVSVSVCGEEGLCAEGTLGSYTHLESSGKLLALNELLRSAGVCNDELTAADNDTSLLYCDGEGSSNDASAGLGMEWAGSDAQDGAPSGEAGSKSGSKCLIFAQFSQSLDVVERFLFEPHMPSLRYLRMDGQVPLEKRAEMVDTFNNDNSIKVMLLTTRVGGLGLNLTGADTVIFMEHDWNPHVDLQAMDRAHRLGQTKTVNVYRLVTSNTIEEQIMKLQETKLAISNAIVNTDNSTMYSMGTDRLLDIFSFRSDNDNQKQTNSALDGTADREVDVLDEEYSAEDYSSLSVQEFIRGFQQANPEIKD